MNRLIDRIIFLFVAILILLVGESCSDILSYYSPLYYQNISTTTFDFTHLEKQNHTGYSSVISLQNCIKTDRTDFWEILCGKLSLEASKSAIEGTSYAASKLLKTQPAEIINNSTVRNIMESIETKIPNSIDPIIVRVHKGDAFVVDGHHRLQAFENLGYDRVPIKYIHENQIIQYGRTLNDLLYWKK